MSDRMSVSEAREWLPMAESHDVNANISRLLRTAISQAEQIERLQDALREIMIDLQYAERVVHDIEHPMREWREPGGVDYGLLPDDMEPPA